jgi:predicted nuclease of predicted toxin-antitoxin system
MSKKLRFYTDEQVSNSVVKGLQLRGVDVLTTKDAGMFGGSDEDHVAFAKKEGRVIFSQDEDFLRLHAQGFEHSGIVYAHQRTPIGEIVRALC